jgi:type IV pilus assembly protein PilQ
MSRAIEGAMSKNMVVKTALVVCALLPAAAGAAPENRLSNLLLSPTSTGVEVRVGCSQQPTFNVFRLKDPDRLVVDVSGATAADVKGHRDGLGPVTGIVTSQFSDARSEVARLLIGLEGAQRYDVKSVEGQLVITIDSAAAANSPVASAPAPASEPVAQVPAPAPSTRVPGETVIASRVDEKPVKAPAHRLKAVSASATGLRLVTDGEIARFEVIELADPPRLAIDLFDLGGTPRAPRVSTGQVRDVRVGSHDGKVRVVVEFAERATFDVRRKPDGLTVSWGLAPAQEAQAAAPAGPEVAMEIDGQQLVDDGPSPASAAEVVDVKFLESPQGGVVQLKLKGHPRHAVQRPDARTAVLTLENTRVARLLEKGFDTSSLQTPIKMVSVFAVPGAGQRVRVVVGANQDLEQSVSERGGVLQWRFGAPGVEQSVGASEAAGFSVESSTLAEESAPQQRRGYVGKRVSFEFKDIDLHNLLRIIAEISKKNIIVADDVGGKITIRLRNVPWDQALDLVLRSKGLGKEEFGNIMRVAPLGTLEGEAKARAARRKADHDTREVTVALVPVNYATAGDMSIKVKDVLTDRGTVTIDTRTNTLIVRDLPENLGRVRSMVASLDLQTPQVLIEGRIVEASTTFRREVGIQWGGQAAMSAGTGNPTGLVFPNSVAVTGGITGGNANGVSASPNYAVSLPVGASDGAGGALGFVFGSAGGAALLNLRLSALEASGTIKTISAPKVTTLDNLPAKISQGVSVPYSQTSAAGANTTFVEARLSLDVTPHITQEGTVLMQINASNNQPDPSNSGSNGQPAISRKEASTNVLVKDGETTVIGGIYVRTGGQNQAGLPILSKIPVIGFFFRNSRETETKTELLIFITPRILNRTSVAQNQ